MGSQRVGHHWATELTELTDRDFRGSPVVGTAPSSEEGVGFITGWGVKIPHAEVLIWIPKFSINQQKWNKFRKNI